jgi:polysaccharide deacetylase family protein (PEP-CTERM system associated)
MKRICRYLDLFNVTLSVKKQINILTFDIEDWYHCAFVKIPENQWDSCESRIEYQLSEILGLLKKTDNKATFFTVAMLARKYPDLIKQIVTEGHELALHSYSHQMITEQSKDDFESDIRNSLDILSYVSNQKIVGFRAPAWSVNHDNKSFVATILKKYGFLYDSSIFPFRTYQYGDSKAPRYPYVLYTENGSSIYEIPPSVIEYLNVRIPFSGGFYFRMLPYAIIKRGIKIMNREGYPAVTYFHHHDIDTGQPRMIKGLKERFIVYANLKKGREKFEKLLHDFRFGRIDEYITGLVKRQLI